MSDLNPMLLSAEDQMRLEADMRARYGVGELVLPFGLGIGGGKMLYDLARASSLGRLPSAAGGAAFGGAVTGATIDNQRQMVAKELARDAEGQPGGFYGDPQRRR